ncbi:MAG: nucleoside monophosphate kinase [Wolbachia endosymbiont of Meromenopon meropis]|nr:nucleoside monophosphate kinase [Wolbachia endosymbiont of Meromenopon meropis]
MIITIFGPPGSGKGTQSNFLVSRYNLKLISVGDLLRAIIAGNSKLGKKIKNIVESGNLIQDDVICKLLLNQLKLVDSDFLLDGFPRNLNQACFLTKVLLKRYNRDVDVVIELQLNDETAVNRLKNRLVCLNCKSLYNGLLFKNNEIPSCIKCRNSILERRIDDSNLSTINRRINEYHIQIKGLREYYKNKLLVVNANLNINLVKQKIEDKISCNLI